MMSLLVSIWISVKSGNWVRHSVSDPIDVWGVIHSSLNFLCCHCDNSSSNLKSRILVNLNRDIFSYVDQSSKFRLLVLKVEFAIFVFKSCMQSWYRDIIDSQVWVMSSTEWKLLLVPLDDNCVNYSRRVLLKVHWFKNDVGFVSSRSWNFDQMPNLVSVSKLVGVMHFTELTFKMLPSKSMGVFRVFIRHFRMEPGFQAFVVNVLDCSDTIASSNFRILLRVFIYPAKPAHLMKVCLWDVLNIFGFFKFFLITVFFNIEVLSWGSKFSNFELHSTDFYNVVRSNFMAFSS